MMSVSMSSRFSMVLLMLLMVISKRCLKMQVTAQSKGVRVKYRIEMLEERPMCMSVRIYAEAMVAAEGLAGMHTTTMISSSSSSSTTTSSTSRWM